jgi:hypothetical protein
VKVADSQKVDRIDFAMLRGGVISGRIVDDVGEPVPSAMVQAIRSRQFETGSFNMAGTASTDDLGQFRLHGLQPGEYTVSVSPRNMNAGGELIDVCGVPARFPGTTSIAKRSACVQADSKRRRHHADLAAREGIGHRRGCAKQECGAAWRQRAVRPALAVPRFGNVGGMSVQPGSVRDQNVAPSAYNLEVRGNGPEPLFAARPSSSWPGRGEPGAGAHTGATVESIFEGGRPYR